MKRKGTIVSILTMASGCALYGQGGSQRTASIVGGGRQDWGKCTIEVVVDGAAEVEIRGNTGTLRSMAGQPPQWRRFECSSPMPPNPVNFNFSGVDGRGRQTLARDPRNGGGAVVQIEDREGGSEGYTFDLTWGAGGGQNDQAYNRGNAGRDPGYDRNGYGDEGLYRQGYRDTEYYRRYNHGFGTEEAVRVCQDEIQRQALARFRRAEVHFTRTRLDDGPGRQDWVVGAVDVHRGPRGERFRFSCSVDFNSGRVRTATLDPLAVSERR